MTFCGYLSPCIAFLCFAFSAFASKASGAEAQLSADNLRCVQQDLDKDHLSLSSFSLGHGEHLVAEPLANRSMSDFIEMIAVSIEGTELTPDELLPMNNEVTPDWADIFTTSHQYHLIETSTPDGLTFARLSKSDLAAFIALDEISQTATSGYASHNIFGIDYLIWPYSEGRHELGQVLHWPLQAIIGFHNRVEGYNGVMQLSTNDYRAHAQFTNGASEITLSFTAAEFITAPVFITNARLDIGDRIYEAELLIAQIFGNGHSQSPLFGQFVMIAPDALAPHYGMFESQ